MLIPPNYVLTPKISELLGSIESSRAIIDSVNIPAEIEANIKRRSTLRSSLFSARIEGNSLTIEDLPRVSSKDQKRIEIYNILKALNFISQRHARDLTLKDILNLHEMVMDGLIEKQDLGKFRTEANAIYNTAGIAIYLPPRPSQISSLLSKLLTYINSSKEQFVPIRAGLAHYIFEKIHPFLDGNGRVGRLLIQAVLTKGGYGMKGLASLEEYLDKERADYYHGLENTERDVTDYLEFMLECIASASIDAKTQVLEKKDTNPQDFLLPRRAELFNIINDQKLINFDSLRRRFLAINERTLRYDLKKLQDGGFIRKRGTTKGVYYEPSPS